MTRYVLKRLASIVVVLVLIYVSAMGLAFSETVLVTESGAERLTRAERVLFAR